VQVDQVIALVDDFPRHQERRPLRLRAIGPTR